MNSWHERKGWKIELLGSAAHSKDSHWKQLSEYLEEFILPNLKTMEFSQLDGQRAGDNHSRTLMFTSKKWRWNFLWPSHLHMQPKAICPCRMCWTDGVRNMRMTQSPRHKSKLTWSFVKEQVAWGNSRCQEEGVNAVIAGGISSCVNLTGPPVTAGL